jgi:hypothetical protein
MIHRFENREQTSGMRIEFSPLSLSGWGVDMQKSLIAISTDAF